MPLRDVLDFCVSKKLITIEDVSDIRRQGVDYWKSKNDYPLLHLICNKVVLEDGDNCLYLQNARSLIEAGADPDILSKYNDSSLHHAAQTGKERLAKMLVRSGANTNLLNRDGRTPLELAVLLSEEFLELITYLARKTNPTNNISQTMQEEMREAVEDWETDKIRFAKKVDLLLDLNLAHPPQRPIKTHDCPELLNGCWIRTVPDVAFELKILKKREGKTAAQLQGHREWQPNELNDPNSIYTPYSPATFVHSGVPIALYGLNDAGVIIKRLNRPISYWYDGHNEQLTRVFSYNNNRKPDNGEPQGQLWNASEDAICQAAKKRFDNYVNELNRYEMDRHGVIFHKEVDELRLRWNEGSLRYQSSDVVGILVCTNDKDSAIKALQLRHALSTGNYYLPLYQYEEGTCKRVRSAELMSKFGLDERGRAVQVQQSALPVQHLRAATMTSGQTQNNANTNRITYTSKKT